MIIPLSKCYIFGIHAFFKKFETAFMHVSELNTKPEVVKEY